MPTIEVFDPAMCCSSGVCGPDPDAALIRFSADLDWIRSEGADVRRYNLSQEPAAFVANPTVKKILDTTEGQGLPVVMVDGKLFAQGVYPSRDELAACAGLSCTGETDPPDLPKVSITPAVAELIALGAAIAADCEACFEHHYSEALKLGVSKEEMIVAVNIALQVKETSAQTMVQLAQKYLLPGGVPSGSCCGEGSSRCCG